MLGMGTWSSPFFRSAVLRVSLSLFGLSSALWSLTASPSFWQMMPARDAAARIVADERFKPHSLKEMLLHIESAPPPFVRQAGLLSATALISLLAQEDTLRRKAPEEADREADAARRRLTDALGVNPTNSYLWFMLYSVDLARIGAEPSTVAYLERSYALGPHEGWIARRRNRLALAALPMLTEFAQLAAISEYEEMVDADFIEEAALNLLGVGWPYRARLIAALVSADIVSKTLLYRRIEIEGIKLAIPGISIDERPWR